jgi:hypothetical protein
MYSGSSDGESHEATQRKIPPASSMPWARNLRRFIGSGTGLGSEALMGPYSLSLSLSLSLLHFFQSVFLLEILDRFFFVVVEFLVYVHVRDFGAGDCYRLYLICFVIVFFQDQLLGPEC